MIYVLVHTLCCDKYFIVTITELFLDRSLHEHSAFETLWNGSKEECEIRRIEIIAEANDLEISNVCQN